jgi:FkbM family methyltransferase
MDIGGKLLYIPRFLLTRKLRGGTRLMRILANRFPSLQSYKAKVCGGSLYVDLRNNGTHSFLTEETSLREEHEVMKRVVRVGDVAYDIGANAGVFTVWLSSLVGKRGRVFSFEPNPAHHRSLEQTIELLANTELIRIGLSDVDGSFEFFVPEDDTMASLRDWTIGEGGQVSKTTCRVGTIDGLVAAEAIPKADFIKCDIEGGELDCFKGGQSALNAEDAPIILFEANINSSKGYGNEISSGMDFLASLGAPRYAFFLVADDAILEPISLVTFRHGNILAVPFSRMNRLDPDPIEE